MTTVSNLTDHTGYWLRMVSNAVSTSFARRVEGAGVTVAEWALLRCLFDHEAGVAPSAVAQAMGMTRGAISKLSDRLIGKGFVRRIDSTRDRRAHTLFLTPEGASIVPRLAALADANDDDFFGALSPDERKAFEATLMRLVTRRGLTTVPVD